MKNVYIVLTQTGTILARTIKLFTAEAYNHASICLDESFETLYSFGRLRPYNPFIGGFLIENAFTHVFGRFENVPCMVIKKEVTDEQYASISNKIEHFIHNASNYKFDIPNMILAKTNITLEHENKFFCSEFVGHLLEESGIELPNTLEKMRPYQFALLDNAEVIYKGELKEWCGNEAKKVLMK